MHSYLAFDWGVKRIGVASGSDFLGVAQGLTTLQGSADELWQQIAQLVDQWRPSALVVGIPSHPDGAAHQNTRNARTFASELAQRTQLPVHQVDERYSTTEARRQLGLSAQLRSRKSAAERTHRLDATAACIILEQFLNPL